MTGLSRTLKCAQKYFPVRPVLEQFVDNCAIHGSELVCNWLQKRAAADQYFLENGTSTAAIAALVGSSPT